jgi:hypothetical protein
MWPRWYGNLSHCHNPLKNKRYTIPFVMLRHVYTCDPRWYEYIPHGTTHWKIVITPLSSYISIRMCNVTAHLHINYTNISFDFFAILCILFYYPFFFFMVTTIGMELLTKKNPHHLLRALLTRHNVKEPNCKLCQLGCLCEHVASLPMQITLDQYQIINTYSSLLMNMYRQPQ